MIDDPIKWIKTYTHKHEQGNVFAALSCQADCAFVAIQHHLQDGNKQQQQPNDDDYDDSIENKQSSRKLMDDGTV